MNEVTVASFRCFNEEQTALLAPLTILVGENSTGKTSFLALLRALWDIALHEQLPDFKESPYDLGSFDEIAHYRSGRGGRASNFRAGFSHGTTTGPRSGRSRTKRGTAEYRFTFRRDRLGLFPSVRRVAVGPASAECRVDGDGAVSFSLAVADRSWKADFPVRSRVGVGWQSPQRDLVPLGYLVRRFLREVEAAPEGVHCTNGTAEPPGTGDREALMSIVPFSRRHIERPFASAPVRSRPRRTYDPSQAIPEPEGEHIPMLLATMAQRDENAWNSLKGPIEQFGRDAGLFDDIAIKVLGGKSGGPFQVQVRKRGRRAKGPLRNLIDVGYGVNQVLPVVTELLRSRGPRMFLLQQPEVHLHPSAQAALGGLFGSIASKGRKQIVVETHSDHLIDRIRMDIRDGNVRLPPGDVSILYFERRNLAVKIHSLGWDADGNLIARRGGGVPDSYRQFFRTERRRSLGL